jgi:hypothetical protein
MSIRARLWLFIVSVWVMALLVFMLTAAGGGCSARSGLSTTPDSLPAVGNGVERVGAHVDSAERLNVAAKPLAGKAARPLMDQVSAEHGAAEDALGDTRRELKASTDQRGRLERENIDQAKTIASLTGGWGYRLQLFVTRAAWILAGIAMAHVALGIAAPFVPGVAGSLMAKVGVLLNPAAWFQSARDNFYFRAKAAR